LRNALRYGGCGWHISVVFVPERQPCATRASVRNAELTARVAQQDKLASLARHSRSKFAEKKKIRKVLARTRKTRRHLGSAENSKDRGNC